MNDAPKLAFVSGYRDWWRKQALTMKYLKMRMEGVVYPDVYCLPLMLAPSFQFLSEGARVGAGEFDLIFAELQSSESQLRYLEALALAGDPPLAIIPGPPEILARDLTNSKLALLRQILHSARYVLAYSREIKTFVDGFMGFSRAQLIPWPYDLDMVERWGRQPMRDTHTHRILVQLPLRFQEVTQNYPFILKSILLDVWEELPDSLRKQITFHTFVYTPGDLEVYRSSNFSAGLPFVLETKHGYRSFLKFLGQCQGVINLTAGAILGRITFAAAALNRPGIFTDNAECNRRLYPRSSVSLFDTLRLRDLVRELLLGLESGRVSGRLLADHTTVQEMGDLPGNKARLQRVFTNDQKPTAPKLSAILAGQKNHVSSDISKERGA
jgi:hypothetical protein